MTTAYMGIDPGKTGAVAVICRGEIELYKTPMIGSTGKKSEFDILAMAQLLRHWAAGTIGDCYLTIEKAQVFPKQGVASSGNFMMGYGIWLGIINTMKIPHEIVTPRTWQKEFFKGLDLTRDPKKNSEIIAKRLFPSTEFKASERSKNPHSGFIDALLIAEYGRRKINR